MTDWLTVCPHMHSTQNTNTVTINEGHDGFFSL